MTIIDRTRAEHSMELQTLIITFLMWIYAFLILATMAIVVLQGFRLGGFLLDGTFLKWLGAATVGEMSGLLTLTLTATFKTQLKG